MAGTECAEGVDDTGTGLDPVLEQWNRERVDRRMLFGRRRSLVEVTETVAQAPQEHLTAVAVGGRVRTFDVEQHCADLRRRERRVREPVEVVVDHSLEQVVVLPEGVIGVEDEGLLHEAHDGRCYWGTFKSSRAPVTRFDTKLGSGGSTTR